MDKLIKANELVDKIDGMGFEVESYEVIKAISGQPDASSEIFEVVEAETNEDLIYGVLKKPLGKFNGIIIDGGDEVVFPCSRVGGYTTLQACEEMCERYYRCDTVAMMDDILKDYECVEKD